VQGKFVLIKIQIVIQIEIEIGIGKCCASRYDYVIFVDMMSFFDHDFDTDSDSG